MSYNLYYVLICFQSCKLSLTNPGFKISKRWRKPKLMKTIEQTSSLVCLYRLRPKRKGQSVMVQLIGKFFLLEFPQGKVLMKLNQLSFSPTIVLRELILFHSGVLLTGGAALGLLFTNQVTKDSWLWSYQIKRLTSTQVLNFPIRGGVKWIFSPFKGEK